MNLLLEGDDLEALLVRAHQEGGTAARIVRAEKIRRGGFLGFFAREGFEVAVEIPRDEQRGPDDEPTTPATAADQEPQVSAVVQPDDGAAQQPAPGLAPEPKPPATPASLLGLAERASAAERAAAKAVAANAAYEAAQRAVPAGPDTPAPRQVEALTGHVVAAPANSAPDHADSAPPVVTEEFVTEKFAGQAYVYDADQPESGHEIDYVAEHVEFTRIEFPPVTAISAQTAAEIGTELAAELGSGWTIETSASALNDDLPSADHYRVTDLSDLGVGPEPDGHFGPVGSSDGLTEEPIGEYSSSYADYTDYGYPDADPQDHADLADLSDFSEHGYEPADHSPNTPVPYQGSAASASSAASSPTASPAEDPEHPGLDDGSAPLGGRPQFASLIDQLRENVRLGRHRNEGPRHTPDHPAVAAMQAAESMVPESTGVKVADPAAPEEPADEPTPAQVEAWNQVVHDGSARATTVVPRAKARRASRSLPTQRPSDDNFSPIDTPTARPAALPVAREAAPEADRKADREPALETADRVDEFTTVPKPDTDSTPSSVSAPITVSTPTTVSSVVHDEDLEAEPTEPDFSAGTSPKATPRTSAESAWRLLRAWRPGSLRKRDQIDSEIDETEQWTPEDLEEETPELGVEPEFELAFDRLDKNGHLSFAETAVSGEVPAAAATISTLDQLAADREALRELGVPAAWTRHLRAGDRFTSIVAMLGRLSEVDIPEDTAVIAVIGAPSVVELEAHRTAVDLPGEGRPRAVTVVSGLAGVDRRSAVARSKRVRPVVVAIPIDSYDDPAAIRRVLAGVKAEKVIAVVDASQPLEEITRWVESLEQVDALALDGALEAGRPASVLALDVPVIRVDGISVDRIGWAALLCAQLSGAPAAPEPLEVLDPVS